MANPAIALQRLLLEERIKTGCSHRAVIDYTDLTDTAGLSKVLTLKGLVAGDIVNFAFFDIVKAFAGTTTLAAKLGVTGSDAAMLANKSIIAGGQVADGTFVAIYSAQAAINLILTFTATVDNLTALTAGKLFVYVNIIPAKDPALQPLSAP